MKKRAIYAIVVIALAAVLIFSVYNLTGKATTVGEVGKCIETDSGNDMYTQGITNYENRGKEYVDYCYSRRADGQLKYLHEYFCLGRMTSKRYFCENGCFTGYCLR